jgi:tetratricopeptide (TPR) repeat protein
MDQSPQREEELFPTALALPVAERQRYLEQACGGDTELLRRVQALLRVHEKVGDFLETPAVADLPDVARAGEPKPPPEEAAGTMIGRYKLLQKIGEGGCGVVYMAEQKEPVHRRVALKVIRLGMDTKEVIARFEAERQALALMDHPNIARVFDAGATDIGRPYFVMELVRGVKITDYCDQQNLSTAERLNLFVQVCHAIQHAHQKGIIHRDIKPSNILVTLQDGEPVPKVIDFGIAKATQGRLTDQTLFTAFEQFIGTPAYMSPEQAQLSSADVDTRSDIYSLGVLLYELLTGHTPFESQELLKVGLDEMRRQIREVEPPKPSTRLRTLEAEALTTTAQHRATEPPKLLHLVRGDLDWIVMRCLEKKRARRYETANELARDLERHLHDEPVAVCPPSALYRFQKMVRRNKLVVTAAAAIAAALVIGLGVSTWEYLQEKAARERAVAAEEQQSRLRQEAEAARERAVAAEAEQRQLRQEADTALQRAVAAEEEQGRQRQDAEQARDSEARQRAVAEAARNDETQQRMLAEEARNNEARQRAQAEAARKMAETEASKSRQVAQFLTDMLQGVGPSVALGRDPTLLWDILDKTADRVGKDLKDQPAVELQLRTTLGSVYEELGDYQKAEAMQRTALALRRKLLGDAHPEVAGSLNRLAAVLLKRGDLPGAEALCREALAMQRKLLGNESPDVATTLNNLAEILWKRGNYAEAEPLLLEALDLRQRLFGHEHPAVVVVLNNLAELQAKRGDYAGAEALYREVLPIQRKLLGDEHPDVATTLNNFASVLAKRGDLSGAEAMIRAVLTMQRKLLGNEHPSVAISLNNLAQVVARRGDPQAAERMLRTALEIQQRQLGNEHPDIAVTLNNLAAIRSNRADYTGAEPLFRQALAIQRKQFGRDHPEVAITLSNLSMALWKRGNLTEAEATVREALAIQRKLFPNGNSDSVTSLEILAGILSQRGDLTTANETLLEAARVVETGSSELSNVRRSTIECLAAFYAGWAKEDPTKATQAAAWKKKLDEFDEANAKTNASGKRP